MQSPTTASRRGHHSAGRMKMEARRMLAHLLDRKGKNRGAGRRAGEGGASAGRLSRSEPAIHALGPDLARRPLNNAITRG